MDCSDSLDLCLSCGNHVADGTPYCSLRCSSLDRSARRATAPSSSQRPHRSSSSSCHRSQAQSSSHPHHHYLQRRALLDFQDPSSSHVTTPTHSDEDGSSFFDMNEPEQQHLPTHVKKLASIAEWAEGVWGGAASDEEDGARVKPSSTARKLVLVHQQQHSASQSKPMMTGSPSSSSHRRPRPQFTLSVAQVAPPAMSITTSLDDDNSSVLTPSSVAARSSSSSMAVQHKRKTSSGSGSVVNPWIASPPYEFAYTHQHGQQHQQQPMMSSRGRTMARA